jgi:preprotein translocase subunit SecD
MLSIALCAGCLNGRGVSLEIRVVEHEPGEGLTETALSGWGRTESFYFHDEVLLTNADVDSAAVARVSGRPVVEVYFSDTGGKRFAEITSRNLGKRLGIFINGELVAAPLVQAEIGGGKAMINGDFTEEEAIRIAQGLSGESRSR